jgi:hypothetical protein
MIAQRRRAVKSRDHIAVEGEDVSTRGLTALVLTLAIASPACARKEDAAGVGAPDSLDVGKTGARSESLVDDKALVDGHLVLVSHSKWDGGQTSDLFDTNPVTMARTEAANPAILEFRVPEARPLGGISIQMGGAEFRVTATLKPAAGGTPRTYTKEFRNSGPDPELQIDFDTGAERIESLRVEILDLDSDDGHIHIRTVRLR